MLSYSFLSYIVIIILSLVMGRLASVLTAIFSAMHDQSIQKHFGNFLLKYRQNKSHRWLLLKSLIVDFRDFFLECQKKWGYFPLFGFFLKDSSGIYHRMRFFIIELIILILFLSSFFLLGWKFLLFEYFIFIFALIVAGSVDIEQMILPDSLTLTGILIGLIGAILNPERDFWPALFGVLSGGGFLWVIAVLYYTVRKEEGLGGGDIKLLAWIGAVLSWKAVPFIIIVSSFTGLIAGLIIMFKSKNFLKVSIPYGPYLIFSSLLYIFYGEQLAHLYISFAFYLD